MSNYQTSFRDMVSVPSQLNTASFGASTNSTNSSHPFSSSSQSPFAFANVANTSTNQQAAALALFNRFAASGGTSTPMKTIDLMNFAVSPFGGHHPTSTTPLGFSENEFPSLTRPSLVNRGAAGFGSLQQRSVANSFGASRGTPGKSPYASLMKQVDAQPEFQIQNEDFPALPGSQEIINTSNRGGSPLLASGDGPTKDLLFSGERRLQSTPKKGIQTHPDGLVTGIPSNMLCDQFGMVGLLSMLRAVENDATVVSLALGSDLTQLGLNLNAPEKNLYQTFGGPWADLPCRAQDIDCQVPNEYLTNAAIAGKLAPIKLNRYGEDLLFYLFYNFGGEIFQLAAAAELYNRDWRYHKEERVWITRAPGVEIEKTQTYARGTFYVFDPASWRKVQREMHLDFSKLEERPMIPPQPPQIIHQPQQSITGLPNIGLSNAVHNNS